VCHASLNQSIEVALSLQIDGPLPKDFVAFFSSDSIEGMAENDSTSVKLEFKYLFHRNSLSQ
jgi:hypothetical protein